MRASGLSCITDVPYSVLGTDLGGQILSPNRMTRMAVSSEASVLLKNDTVHRFYSGNMNYW